MTAIKILEDEYPSYSTVRKEWAAEFKRGDRGGL